MDDLFEYSVGDNNAGIIELHKSISGIVHEDDIYVLWANHADFNYPETIRLLSSLSFCGVLIVLCVYIYIYIYIFGLMLDSFLLLLRKEPCMLLI